MKNIQGERYGYLEAVKALGWCAKVRATKWLCRCACGNEIVVQSNNLKSGNSKSCGCINGVAVSDKITQEQLRLLVHYDTDTGLLYKLRRGGSGIGSVLGVIDRSTGYQRVSIARRKYWAHRLIWFYMTGAWPSKQIDHVDRNRANNAWSNLRLATQTENNGNSTKPVSNTTGYKGVTLDKKRNLYIAQIGFNNKTKYLGCFCDPVDAALAYDAAARQLFGSFALTNFG